MIRNTLIIFALWSAICVVSFLVSDLILNGIYIGYY